MEEAWIATTATVTTCRYQSPGLGTLAFGFSTRQRFLITFDYYAHGRLFSDQFQSAIAIPQNDIIPISYNAYDPQQNSRTNRASGTSSPRPNPLLAIGVAGSVVLSLAWLLILRSCR